MKSSASDLCALSTKLNLVYKLGDKEGTTTILPGGVLGVKISSLLYWGLSFVADGFYICAFSVLLKPAFFMELVLTKWVCTFLLCSWLIFSGVYSGR